MEQNNIKKRIKESVYEDWKPSYDIASGEVVAGKFVLSKDMPGHSFLYTIASLPRRRELLIKFMKNMDLHPDKFMNKLLKKDWEGYEVYYMHSVLGMYLRTILLFLCLNENSFLSAEQDQKPDITPEILRTSPLQHLPESHQKCFLTSRLFIIN